MSFDERTQSFILWLSDNGIEISPKIEIQDLRLSGQGRSVIAKDDISEDEVLFSIPRSATLSVQSCSLIQDLPESIPILNKLGQWEALILVFLYEWKVKGDDSLWKAYFNVLPVNDESYKSDQLMFWSTDELQDLKPSYVIDRIGHESALEMYQGLIPNFTKFIGVVSETEFHSVASVIMSYSFDVDKKEDRESSDAEDMEDYNEEDKEDHNEDGNEDESAFDIHRESEESEDAFYCKSKDNEKESQLESEDEETDNDTDENSTQNSLYLKSMVPLADTLNADSRKHNAKLFVNTDNLVMRTIAPIPKGAQIYNIYSEHPNAEILRRYGYVEQNGSVHDFAEVSLATVKKYFAENSSLSIDFIEEIMLILQEIELEQGETFVLDTYDCFASGSVIFELTFIAQLFVIIAAINHKKSFNTASSEVKGRAIRRVFKKTYQLLESKKLTLQFMKDFSNILKVRLAEYPRKATRGFPQPKTCLSSRPEMANVVLASECHSLQVCMDTQAIFVNSDDRFCVIDDEKLLRNIMKRDIFEGSEPRPHKKPRLV